MGVLLAVRHSDRQHCYHHGGRHVSFGLIAVLYVCACISLLLSHPSRLTAASSLPRGGWKGSHVERADLLQEVGNVGDEHGDSQAVLGRRVLMTRGGGGGDRSSRSGSVRSLRFRSRRHLLTEALESAPTQICQANFSSIDFGALHGSCNQMHMTREGCCLPLLRIIGPRLLLELRFMSTACVQGLFVAMTDQGIDPNDLLDFCLPHLSPRVKLGTEYMTQAQESGGSVDQMVSGVVATAAEVYGHYTSAPGSEYDEVYDSQPSDYADFGPGYNYEDELAGGSSYYPDAALAGYYDGEY